MYSSNQKHRERKKELNKENYNRQKASRTVERKNYIKVQKQSSISGKKGESTAKLNTKTDVVFQRKIREYSTKKCNTNDLFKRKLIEYSTNNI